ncbi:MAG: permease-like cell division protein FtsX [Firmicutes bacterium]|nr:permease-like cell division protein FtsX [Bacillota bacterium]MDY5856944.1 permease-like cell division protein FtsX [Anaerovoracaceae bacterium]
MLRSLIYNIRQGFTQIFRNRGMSLASIFSITAMLLILGLFFVIMVNINMFTEAVKQDYDQIEVFLMDSTSQEETMNIMSQLKHCDGVTDVEYRSEDEALEIMKQRWGESGYLLDTLGENPLPSSILITVDSLDHAGQVAEYAGTFDGVEDIQYYQETVEKLTKITDFLQIAALIVMAFLVVVSVVVVSNTVKLTVFARAREIRIMKYIGATNWFIRGPFLAEGILIGMMASAIATGLIALIYGKIVELIGAQVLAIVSCPLISVSYLTENMVIIFLALGMSIGAWGSIVSMRRFLDT